MTEKTIRAVGFSQSQRKYFVEWSNGDIEYMNAEEYAKFAAGHGLVKPRHKR